MLFGSKTDSTRGAKLDAGRHPTQNRGGPVSNVVKCSTPVVRSYNALLRMLPVCISMYLKLFLRDRTRYLILDTYHPDTT
jgi:hypothetical protein